MQGKPNSSSEGSHTSSIHYESEASLRGFTSKRERRSTAARRAWRQRRREGYRPAGRKIGHQRDQHLGLSLAYRIQQINRVEFDKRFEQLRARQERRVSERGRQTVWVEYLSCMAVYRTKGQDFKTTNSQRAAALAARNRPRCSRTIQRVHKDLAEMGLLRRAHVRRGGSRAGRRDCLRVFMTSSFVTPPSAAGAAALRAAIAPASRPLADKSSLGQTPSRDREPALPALGPPDGGDGAAVKLPNNNDSKKKEGPHEVDESDSAEENKSLRESDSYRLIEEIEAREGVSGVLRYLRERRERGS